LQTSIRLCCSNICSECHCNFILKTLICMLILIFHFVWEGMMVWKIDIAF
jgi:hypothetical protein